jgi:hypothetical protein
MSFYASIAFMSCCVALVMTRCTIGAYLSAHFTSDADVMVLNDKACFFLFFICTNRTAFYTNRSVTVIAAHRDECMTHGVARVDLADTTEQHTWPQQFFASACYAAGLASNATVSSDVKSQLNHDQAPLSPR